MMSLLTLGVMDHGVFAITIPGSVAANVQELNLTQTDAQYVRLEILDNHGGAPSALGEVAFDIEPTVSVPAPTIPVLLSFGIAAIGIANRKRTT